MSSVTAAVLAVVAGLGGGVVVLLTDEGLSRGELIARGDEVCAESNELLAAAREEHEGVPFEAGDRAAEAVEALNAPGERTTRELKELEPAEDLREQYDSLLELRDQRDAGFREVLAAVGEGDADAAGEAQVATIELAEGPLLQQAEEIGFQVCGQPLARPGEEQPAEEQPGPQPGARAEPDAPADEPPGGDEPAGEQPGDGGPGQLPPPEGSGSDQDGGARDEGSGGSGGG